LLVLTHWLAITNFFPVNGISEVVDLSRHDWNNLGRAVSLNVLGVWPLGNKRLTVIRLIFGSSNLVKIANGSLLTYFPEFLFKILQL
jgi:hypothetical protein